MARQRFWILVWLEGSLLQDSVNLPTFGARNVSASVSSIEVCDLPTVEATDHQSDMIGHPSCHPI